MRRIAAPLLVILAAFFAPALANQPTPPRKPPTVNCKPPLCVVTITVPTTCGSGIQVSPEPIVVSKSASLDISWQIVGEGWTFDKEGIYIHKQAATLTALEGGGKVYKLKKNPAETGAIYKYDINLIGPDKKPCTLDPTILDW